MKRRSLTLVVCLLATLSLASVGFAAWVISAGDVENLTGNITVHEVEDERINIIDIKYDGSAETDGFVFGQPADTVAKAWLTNEDDYGNPINEKLEIVITFKVVKASNGTTPVTDAVVTCTFGSTPATFKVGETEETYIEVVDTTPDVTNNGDGTYSVTIELQWGTHWGEHVSPYTYYNAKNPNAFVNGVDGPTFADDAKTRLEAMYAAVNAGKFNVTIDAQPAE